MKNRTETMNNISLKKIDGFPRFISQKLASCGVNTAVQFVSLARIHSTHKAMRRALNLSEEQLDDLTALAKSRLPESCGDLSPVPVQNYMLGVNIEDDPSRESDQTIRLREDQLMDMPEEVNHIPYLSPVRNQGSRGTCVAFATVAAREFESRKTAPLSEQFLYDACKERDNHDGPGTYISTAMQCLADIGVCPAKYWPYNTEPMPGNEGQGPPPSRAVKRAKRYRIERASNVTASNINELKSILAFGADGAPQLVTFGIPVYPSWGNAETDRTGMVPMPFEGEEMLGGHALCLVGYKDDAHAPGGGWFLFRNSWGDRWANESPYASGYGMLPYAYMEKYGRSAYVLHHSRAHLCMFPQNSRKWQSNWAAVMIGILVGSLIWFGTASWSGKVQMSAEATGIDMIDTFEVPEVIVRQGGEPEPEKSPITEHIQKEEKLFKEMFEEIKAKLEKAFEILFS